jgi:hypothetical protein
MSPRHGSEISGWANAVGKKQTVMPLLAIQRAAATGSVRAEFGAITRHAPEAKLGHISHRAASKLIVANCDIRSK